MGKTGSKGRNSSIELLRVLCLVLICWMHSAGGYEDNNISAWIKIALEVLGNIGVSCFILISGYYGIRLNIKKLMHLDLMLIFYSWAGLILQRFVWGNAMDGEAVLAHIFPVIGNLTWYFTCYFALAFLSPFLNEMVEKLGKVKLSQLLITMLVIFSGVTTFFFFDFMGHGGKDIVHMVMLYLIGRYISVYQADRVYRTGKLVLAFAAVAGVNFCLNGALFVVTGTVQNRFARDCTLFTIFQAIILFLIFRNLYFENTFVNRIAKHVPAAFLFEWMLREIVTRYLFDPFVYAQANYYQAVMLGVALLIVALGIVLDWLRVTLLHVPEKWLVEQVYGMGESFFLSMRKRLQ